MNDKIERRKGKVPFNKNIGAHERAIIDKLVRPDQNHRGGDGSTKDVAGPDHSNLTRIAGKTANSVADARNIFQVLPDMQLARQIMVSAVMSPADLTTHELIYSVTDKVLDANISGPMLRCIKEFFKTKYRFNDLVPKILDDVLFMKGSYPLLVLPETSVDYMINGENTVSTESYVSTGNKLGAQLGLLGSPVAPTESKPTFESYGAAVDFSVDVNVKDVKINLAPPETKTRVKDINIPTYITVTDNPDILKSPMIIDRLSSRVVVDKLMRKSVSIEARGDKKEMALTDVQSLFYKSRQFKHIPIQQVLSAKQLERKSVGNPIVMNLPVESVIPVHVPGEPSQHVGYYVMLDANGYPLSVANTDDYYSDIRNAVNSNPEMSSQLLTMTRRATYGRDTRGDLYVNEMSRNFGQMIERDLLNRLRNGALKGEYEISRADTVNRLMLARALMRKHTTMLFVPVELLTYIAFDYNEFGIGKSLLEDGKILASLRAVLLFANTIGAVKNATGTQTLNIELNPEDPDGYGTVERILQEYARVNRTAFPIGDTNPTDIINDLQSAGRNVAVTGGHPDFPEVKFSVEAREGSHKQPDTDLEERLRRQHIQMFSLDPGMMDKSESADYATELVQDQLMLQKRIVTFQEAIRPFLNKFHRDYTVNSEELMTELRGIVKTGSKYLDKQYKRDETGYDKFIFDFLSVLNVELPKPNSKRLSTQLDEFNKYSEAVDALLDNAYFFEEMFDNTSAGPLYESVASTRKVIAGLLKRDYVRSRNIMPEMDELFTVATENESDKDLVTRTEQFTDGLLGFVEAYMSKIHETAVARNKRVAKENAKFEEANSGGDEGGGDSGYDENSTDSDGGFDDTADEGTEVSETDTTETTDADTGDTGSDGDSEGEDGMDDMDMKL